MRKMLKNKLKEIRYGTTHEDGKPFSQREFCKMVGIESQSYYFRIENGAEVKVSTALKIATALNKKVEDIWYEE